LTRVSLLGDWINKPLLTIGSKIGCGASEREKNRRDVVTQKDSRMA
jgi:hypothetical protein